MTGLKGAHSVHLSHLSLLLLSVCCSSFDHDHAVVHERDVIGLKRVWGWKRGESSGIEREDLISSTVLLYSFLNALCKTILTLCAAVWTGSYRPDPISHPSRWAKVLLYCNWAFSKLYPLIRDSTQN